MSKEIEHKFLVKRKFLPNLKKIFSRNILQGYLSRTPVVRIRIMGTEAFLTIKGKGSRVRDEFEFGVPLKTARKLMKLCKKRKIRKVRHYFGPWEIDVFKGRHRGLILAEIELKSERAKLPRLPDWIGKEVTYDSKYSNASLADLD